MKSSWSQTNPRMKGTQRKLPLTTTQMAAPRTTRPSTRWRERTQHRPLPREDLAPLNRLPRSPPEARLPGRGHPLSPPTGSSRPLSRTVRPQSPVPGAKLGDPTLHHHGRDRGPLPEVLREAGEPGRRLNQPGRGQCLGQGGAGVCAQP